VTGQALTLLIVHFLLDFRLPLLPALIVVGCSVLLNLGSMLFHRAGTRLGERAAALYLAYDTLQLAILLYLTGGSRKPVFDPDAGAGHGGGDGAVAASGDRARSARGCRHHRAGPVARTAAVAHDAVRLSARPSARYLGGAGHRDGVHRRLHALCRAGGAAAARRGGGDPARWRASSGSRRSGALAAAAAHELGSPLATIAVIAKELARDLPADSPHAEDAALLLSQSERCRHILAELAHQPEEDGSSPYTSLPISALVEAAGVPYRDARIRLIFATTGDAG
jgi:two-component system sensor histidine kinase RegB